LTMPTLPAVLPRYLQLNLLPIQRLTPHLTRHPLHPRLPLSLKKSLLNLLKNQHVIRSVENHLTLALMDKGIDHGYSFSYRFFAGI